MMMPALPTEQQLVEALADPHVSREDILRLLDTFAPDAPLALTEMWSALAQAESLDAWRRLMAYRLLIERCLIYPLERESFLDTALRPFGLDDDQIIDATMSQNLPIAREFSETISIAYLPIQTPIGQAAVYFAHDRDTGAIMRAGVYPNGSEPEMWSEMGR